jgi:hypothetical protein
MAKGAASEGALAELHKMYADELKKRLQDPEAPASLFKEAREFLKDNGIDCEGAETEHVSNLAEEIVDSKVLPFQTGNAMEG